MGLLEFLLQTVDLWLPLLLKAIAPTPQQSPQWRDAVDAVQSIDDYKRVVEYMFEDGRVNHG